MGSKPFVVTDADNTLWDTDKIYADAQLELLRQVEDQVPRSGGARSLEFVRELDQGIAALHPQHLRYPPELLVSAIACALTGVPAATAVSQSLAGWLPRFDGSRLATQFLQNVMTRVPALRVGVRAGLEALTDKGIAPVVLTEGNMDRCLKLLSQHDIYRFIRTVVEQRKSPDCFTLLQEEFGGVATSYMIGDQPDRDIAFAREAGYTTIYFPGSFAPVWTRSHTPSWHFRINDFSECVPLIDNSSAESRQASG